MLAGKSAEWPERLLFTHVGRWNPGTAPAEYKYRQCSIRSPRWHLVNDRNDNKQEWQLFDVTVDPGEQKNIASDHPDVVARMDAAYDLWWDSIQPQLVNDQAPLAKENPFKVLYEKQFPPK